MVAGEASSIRRRPPHCYIYIYIVEVSESRDESDEAILDGEDLSGFDMFATWCQVTQNTQLPERDVSEWSVPVHVSQRVLALMQVRPHVLELISLRVFLSRSIIVLVTIISLWC